MESEKSIAAKIFAFVVGKEDNAYPVRQLIDIEAIPNLAMVLTVEVISLRIFSLLSFIEATRRVSSTSQETSELKIKDVFSLGVVGAVGNNSKGIIYGYQEFNSLDELTAKVHEVIADDLKKEQENNLLAELFEFSDAEFGKAITGILRPTAEHWTFQVVNGSVVKTKGTKSYRISRLDSHD